MLRKLIPIVLVLAAGAAAFYGLRSVNSSAKPATLTVYCAAGLKKPLEAIAAQYHKETGVTVSLQFGGTGTLLTQLRIANTGDLFLAADEGSLADAKKLGVIREDMPLAIQHPVIAVAKGNPKNIKTLADLERPDVKLALTNPEAAAIGKVSQRLLGPKWEPLVKKASVLKPTVTEVATDTQLGAVDAALLWDSVIPQFGLDMVKVPELSDHAEHATVCVLKSSAFPEEASKFARYLTAPNRGGEVFKAHRFQPAGGEDWVAPAQSSAAACSSCETALHPPVQNPSVLLMALPGLGVMAPHR